MIRTFGPGKSGIINFYNQVVKGVREVKPPEPITIKNLLKSGKKEITEEEFRQLSKVKKGKRIAEDMRAYLEMKGIKVIEKEKAPPPIPEISPQLQNLIMVEGEGRTQSQKKFIVNKLLLAREKLIRQYLSRSPFFKDIDASQIPFLSTQEAKALDKMYTETPASLKNFNIQKKKLYKLGLIKNLSTTDKEEWVRTPLGEASNSVNDVRMKELIKGKGVIEIRPTPTSVYKINNDLKAVDTMLERLRVKTRKDPILVAGKQEELPIETLRELLKTESGRLYVGNYLADRVREKTPEQQYKDITLEWYGKAMTREEARPTLSSAEFVKVVHEAQRRAIVSQNRWTFRKLWDAYRIRLVDVNTIAKDLLNTLGRAGVEPIMRRVVMAGATAEAHRKIENANHLIYKDLKLEPLFDEFIQMKRTIELYRIKEKNLEEFNEAKEKEEEVGIVRPYTKEEARHGLNAFYREQPKEVIVEIERMADEYYKVWHDILLAKRDKGLISNELLEKLEEQIHYSPSLFLHYIDPIAVYEVGERTITEPKSGVERLGEGSTELLYNKTRALLERGLVVAENLIARNDAQLSLLEIAETNPKNGFIKKGEEEKPPVGWSRFHAIRDGEKIAIDLRNDFAKSWIALPESELQPALAKWIGYISLAKVVRPFATGPLAPFFFVTNFFRDIHRAAWVIKSYSPHSPIAIAQLSRDLAETYKDARDKKGAWIDYLKEYGGMQFLSMQGKIEKIGKWGEFLSYMNTLTESWVRLAIRNREIKSGKTPKEATFIARNQLDFAQGGGFAKAIDHGSPYFNAAIQGTRGVLNVIKGDPVRAMIMLSWLGVFVVGLDLANEMINPEGWDDIDDHIKTSHFIITTPIYFRNRKGEKQYVYFKFSKDQGQRFFGAIFQAISEKIRHDKNPLPTVVEGLKQTTPITPETPTNVPLIRALSGMWANYDFWRDRKIWDGLQVEARAEKDERTKQLYLDIAKATGLSPKRLEYFVEAIIGRDIFSSMIGNNYKMITQFLPDETKEDVNKHLLERLVHTPGIRRILGASTPGKKEQNIVNQIMIKKNTIRYMQQFEIDKLMRVGREREARIFAIKETALPPDEEARERLNNYIDNWHKFRDIPFYWRGIRFLPPEDRVVALKKIIEEAETDREKKEIYDILGKRGYELGIIDKAGKFIEEWKRQFTIM
ncbi:MAG: hypothetical protein DDT19_00239 [Syntrophomonadaceae bacterium]|nr:hypothetical protein [Bacillota bacterium]